MTLSIGMITIDTPAATPLASWWAERFGAELLAEDVTEMHLTGDIKKVMLHECDDRSLESRVRHRTRMLLFMQRVGVHHCLAE